VPPRKKTPELGLFDVADGFATRLERVEFAPNINRYKPMPKQDIFHQRQNRHRVVKGGNRAGKTYSSTADDVLVLLRQHPHRQHLYEDRPLRMRFIGTDFLLGIEGAALPLFSQFIPPSKLVNGSWEDSYNKSSHKLTLSDHSTVNFMSYEQDPDKFQAVWLDHIHMDEEPPQPIYEESRLRLIDKNGTMTISMTPVQQMEWLEDDVINPALEGRLPGWSVDELDSEENVYLSSEALAALTAGMSAEQKLIRIRGGYSDTTKVFPEFKGSWPNVIDYDTFIGDLRGDTRWRMLETMDYGYSNPQAWVFIAVHPDGRIVAFDELYYPRVTIPTWAELIFGKRAEISQAIGRQWVPEFISGDPSIGRAGEHAAATGITIQQAYALLGIPIVFDGIVKARSTNQDIGLQKYHMYFERRMLDGELQPWLQLTLDPNNESRGCPNGINELRKARLPHQTLTQKTKANPKEQIRDKDNHWIDAVKYLLIMTHDLRPQEVQEEEFKLTQHEGIREAIGYRPQRSIPIAESDYYDTISHDTFDRQELY
jgi:phage terminase large subunit-like protein